MILSSKFSWLQQQDEILKNASELNQENFGDYLAQLLEERFA